MKYLAGKKSKYYEVRFKISNFKAKLWGDDADPIPHNRAVGINATSETRMVEGCNISEFAPKQGGKYFYPPVLGQISLLNKKSKLLFTSIIQKVQLNYKNFSS